MLPVDFPGRNRILHGPRDEQGQPLTDILDLPSYTNGQICICCWGLTDEEKQQLLLSRTIWVWLWSMTIDPFCISAVCPIKSYGVFVEPVQKDILFQNETHSLASWELTDDEVEYIQTSGVFWFTIQSGYTQPPVGFQVTSPFISHD